MLEQIAMWGGIAGIVIALFAMIILFLTRKNILDILQKDVILFDKNFELKKHAIDSALNLIDELEERGESVLSRPDFIEKAKSCYNDLLCVVTDIKLAEEFHAITLENSSNFSTLKLSQFKISCRKDIGLSVKGARSVKQLKNKKEDGVNPVDITPRSGGLNSFDGGPAFTPTPRREEPTPRPMPRPLPRPTTATPRPMFRPNQPSSDDKK